MFKPLIIIIALSALSIVSALALAQIVFIDTNGFPLNSKQIVEIYYDLNGNVNISVKFVQIQASTTQ